MLGKAMIYILRKWALSPTRDNRQPYVFPQQDNRCRNAQLLDRRSPIDQSKFYIPTVCALFSILQSIIFYSLAYLDRTGLTLYFAGLKPT
ncbi:hypothetical protein BDW69DRAFT_142954 [Aspergillus filifer]